MGVAAAPVVLLGQAGQTLRATSFNKGFGSSSLPGNGRFEELSLVSMCSSVFGLFTALKELEPAIQNGTLPIRLITVLPSHSTQYDAENQETTIPEHPQLILNGGALKGLTKSICKEWSADAGVVQGTCLQPPDHHNERDRENLLHQVIEQELSLPAACWHSDIQYRLNPEDGELIRKALSVVRSTPEHRRPNQHRYKRWVVSGGGQGITHQIVNALINQCDYRPAVLILGRTPLNGMRKRSIPDRAEIRERLLKEGIEPTPLRVRERLKLLAKVNRLINNLHQLQQQADIYYASVDICN